MTRQTERSVEELETTDDGRRCLCPDRKRFPDWRDKRCPVHRVGRS
jgi:hypothetical protein